jgi:hypothetical protein
MSSPEAIKTLFPSMYDAVRETMRVGMTREEIMDTIQYGMNPYPVDG